MSSPSYADGNIIFDTDLNTISAVISGSGVLSGWTPSPHSPADMSVDIALGVGYVGSSKKETTETTNVAITAADASLPRRDIIIWDTSEGALAAVDGTPEAVLPYGETDFKNMKAPKPPDLPASDDILIAEVYVPAGTSAIDAAKIWDGRFLLTQIREDSQVPALPASKVTSGQFPLDRLPRAASGFLEGQGAEVNPAYSALAASDIASGRFGMTRMPDMASGKIMVGQGAESDPIEEARVTMNAEVSDRLQGSSDAEVSTTELSYTLVKELTIEYDGQYRIKFDLKKTLTATAYGKIYRNDEAVGTEQTDTTGTYQTFSEDIAGWTAGDKIQIYAYTTNADYAAWVQNFRVYADGYLVGMAT